MTSFVPSLPVAMGDSSSSDIVKKLNQPLQKMPLTADVLDWAKQRRLKTLVDLARIAPHVLKQKHNLRPLSVLHARTVIEQELGVKWEDFLLLVDTLGAEVAATPWSALGEKLSPELLELPVEKVPLPARIFTYCTREGIATIRDLVSVPLEELAGAWNIGKTSLRKCRKVILRFAQRSEEEKEAWKTGFLSHLTSKVQELPPTLRTIVMRRSGLGSTSESLLAISRDLGIGPERTRQLEHDAFVALCRGRWVDFVNQRFEEASERGVVAIAMIQSDPWWRDVDEELDAIDYFCKRLFNAGWRVMKLDEEAYLARIAPHAVDEARIACIRLLKTLTFPVPLTHVHAQCEAECQALPPIACEWVWSQVRQLMYLDSKERTVLSLGSGRSTQIISKLWAAENPLHYAQFLKPRMRGPKKRITKLPSEVLRFGQGRLGLEKHFPDLVLWQKRLIPRVVRLMHKHGPRRQWHCNELILHLRKHSSLPEWLGQWHLALLLKRSDRVEYLGRLRVTLPGITSDSGPRLVQEQLEKILLEHGQPMAEEALFEQLAQTVGFSRVNTKWRLLYAPFLKCTPSIYGLFARDLPGGNKAAKIALDHIEGLLVRQKQYVSSSDVQRELSKLSKHYTRWTIDICLSVIRRDKRFRISHKKEIGLAQWAPPKQSVRV